MKLVATAVALLTLACGAEPRRDHRVVVALDGGRDAASDAAAVAVDDPWDPPATYDYDPLRPTGPVEPVGVAPPLFPILSLPAPGPLVAGGHPTSLRALSVIDDGTLAVSVDLDGGVRLWPTLDGKHEPVVVGMNRPMTVAVARDGSDLAIVGLDGAGSLEIVRTSPSGEALLRSSLVIERAAVGVLATTAGLVALLDDQSLALFDLRGVRTGTLVPAPGHRIAGLVTRRDRVLALDATTEAMRGRWLELGDAPHWGAETPPLKIDPTTAALSPDLSRIAARVPNKQAVVVVSLVTGKVVARPPIEEGSLADDAVIGYIDARTLAVRTFDGSIEWWRGGDKLETSSTSPFGKIAVADGRVVVASASVLQLCEYDREPKFLGYTVTAAAHVRTQGSSFLVTSGANLIAVDGQLRAKRAIAIPAVESLSNGIDGLVPLDARHAFVYGRNRTGWELHLVDLEDKHEVKHELVLLTDDWGSVEYEPATRMYAVIDNSSVYFGYYDPKTGTASEPARYYLPSYTVGAIRLLDPTTSNGVVALLVQTSDSSTDEEAGIVEIKSVRLDRDTPIEVGRRRTMKLATDDLMSGGLDVQAVLRRAIASRDAYKHRRASPDGKLVAIADGVRITLVERAGNVERWSIPNPGLDDVAWLANGDLVAIGGAIAQLDRATGMLGDRQCGWGFGLWDDEPENAFSSNTCDATAE